MTIVDREKLLVALQTTKPALATKDTIEQLTLVWFDGKTLTASNETGFGIQVPFETDGLRGGIKGSMLLAVMSNSRAKEINMEKDKEGFFIKAGKTRLNLPMHPLKEMLAEAPNIEDNKPYKLSTDVFSIIGKVFISLGPANSATPEQVGITLLNQDKKLYAFASDSATVACAFCDAPKNFPVKDGERIIMPPDFASRLLSISKGTETFLYVDKDSVWARTEKALIFSRLLLTESPIDLLEIITKAAAKIKFVTIPTRLRLALSRAEALMGSKEDLIEFTVVNSVLKLNTSSAYGELKDSMQIEGEHQEIETKLNPRFLKRAIVSCTHIGFSPKASAMKHDKLGFTYLIAPSKG